MTRSVIPLSAALFAFAAQADGLEYSAAAGARTQPLAGAVGGTVGYGRVLWGDESAGPTKYGYVRGAVNLTTSGVVNRGDVELNLFPISFFGLTLGHRESLRLADANWVDCRQFNCKGLLGSSFAKVQLSLGYEGVYLVSAVRFASFRSPEGTQDFADEGSSLTGRQGGDRLLSGEVYLGFNLYDQDSAGFFFETERMTGQGTRSVHGSVYYRSRDVDWTWYVGTGVYHSSHLQAYGPTMYGGVQWTGLEALGLN